MALTAHHVSEPKRVLIVLMGAIGDVVRALPLAGRIRRAWPDSHLAWAVETKSAPILRGHPWIDELIVYDRPNAPWSFAPFLLRVRRGRFDLAIDLQRHLKSGVTSFISGAVVRIGFNRVNAKEFNHLLSTRQIEAQPNLGLKLTQYQAFGDALGLPQLPIAFGLKATADEHSRVEELLSHASNPILGVILGSSWPSRIYFPEAIAEVIRLLAKPTNGSPALFPALIGGPGDTSLVKQVVANLNGFGHVNLAGQTQLRELVAVFERCAVAFGPDSGPMHIAAAVGCPVVSIWGATAAERSAPWGFGDLAIKSEIPCYGCYLRQCPINRECMHRIAPAQIAATVRRAFDARFGIRSEIAAVSC
jgi:heptosyltransferase-1